MLYRMSFSSIIRETQDLGAGLFDTDFNTLCELELTPMHIGSIPGYLRGIQQTLEDGEWYEGDVVVHNHPYLRRQPHPGPRHRGAGLLSGPAGRLRRQHRAPRRHRRGDARADHRCAGRLCRGHALCRHQALQQGQGEHRDVELHPQQQPRGPAAGQRHRGAGRVGADGREALRRTLGQVRGRDGVRRREPADGLCGTPDAPTHLRDPRRRVYRRRVARRRRAQPGQAPARSR